MNNISQYHQSPASGVQCLYSVFTTEIVQPVARPLNPWQDIPALDARDASTSAAVWLVNFADQSRITAICSRLLGLSLDYYADFHRPMSQASVQAALAFFQRHSGTAVPAFSAEPQGYVLATWRKGREVLTLRFKEAGPIQYAVAREVDGEATLKRTWGGTTIDGVASAEFAGASFLLA
jgi:hypothetical protein